MVSLCFLAGYIPKKSCLKGTTKQFLAPINVCIAVLLTTKYSLLMDATEVKSPEVSACKAYKIRPLNPKSTSRTSLACGFRAFGFREFRSFGGLHPQDPPTINFISHHASVTA